MAMLDLSGKISMIFSSMLKPAGKQADHKKLTNYIINIHQKESTREIISELSKCLKSIINYRFFAFAIKQNHQMDIWLDPGKCRKPFERRVKRDFNIGDKERLNYFNCALMQDYSKDPEEDENKLDMGDITSWKIEVNGCSARVYIVTCKRVLDFCADEMDMVLKTAQTAISRRIGMKKLSDAAAIDPLTKCYNRRELEVQLKRNISSAARHGKELSVFMFDLDHFKKINDTHGHQAGDLVLKKVALLVKKNIRVSDVLARYGGEEFISILPGTGRQKAMELAERIRQSIENCRIKLESGKIINVTASFGVASGHAMSLDMARIIHDADAMMYKAKLNGRNTVMPGIIKVCPSFGSKACF